MEPDARWRVSSASATAEVAPTEPNPWRTIWFSPRQTIRELLATDNRRSWLPPFLLFLLGNQLAQVNDLWAQGQVSLPVVVVGGSLGAALAFGWV